MQEVFKMTINQPMYSNGNSTNAVIIMEGEEVHSRAACEMYMDSSANGQSSRYNSSAQGCGKVQKTVSNSCQNIKIKIVFPPCSYSY